MSSGLNTETFTKVMIGSAVVKVAGVVWGVSRGGVQAEIGTVIRNVPFDGKVAEIAGLDRVVGYNLRVTGTFLQLGVTTLQRLEHGITSVAVGTVNNTTPITAQQMFVTGNYVADLQFDILQADTNIIRLEMPLALVEYAISGGAADDEAGIDISFYCRLEPTEDGEEEPVLTTLLVAGDTTIDEGDVLTYTQSGFDQFANPIASGGGTWSVIAGTGTASINSSTGELTALTDGTVTVRYTVGAIFDDHIVTIAPVIPLGDVHEQLVIDLGGDSAVSAIYVTTDGVDGTASASVLNSGGLVTAWEDYRGNTGFGPNLVGIVGERPTWDSTNKRISFDGTDDYMETVASSLFALNGAKALVVIGAITEGGYAVGIVPVAGFSRIIAVEVNSGTYKTEMSDLFTSISSGVAMSATIRTLIISKTAGTTGKIVVPNQSQATAATGSNASGDNSLRLARLDTSPGPNCATMVLKAVLVLNIDPDSTQRAAIHAWAETNLESVDA